MEYIDNIYIIMPEIVLMTMACLILVIDAYLPDNMRHLTFQLSQATLIATAAMVYANYPSEAVLGMSNMVIYDPMSAVLKLFILLTVFVAFIYSRDYLKTRRIMRGEYFVLGLLATAGMLVMVSAHNLLMIYVGLELMSLSLYAMVAMQRDSAQASEAAMKYFILGALASGLLLYGMSILYGLSGSLDLADIAQAIANKSEEHHMAWVFATAFIVVGLAFKFGAVPFHMWLPDVYQGSPTAVTLFLSAAPKLAAFAMLLRLLSDGMQSLHADWQNMLIVLAVLSIVLGNLVAIAQTNLKRMLAYSTISHVGFIMLGVLTGTQEGYAAAMFYTIVYTLMTLGGFGMILLMSRAGFEADEISDYKGLNERNSWYAFIMMILVLSMAGVPPMLGFWAKLSVLYEIVKVDLIWLAILGVVFSVIGAFYYLRIIWVMYFEKPEDNAEIEGNIDMQIALSLNGLAILGLGLMPQGLMAICVSALT